MPNKQQRKGPPREKPTISNDNHDQNVGQRGEATTTGGNKIHGDDLEGMIPGKSDRETRPTRDDGDNDDKGELK